MLTPLVRRNAKATSGAHRQQRTRRVTGSPRQAKQSAPLSDLDVQLLPAASVAAVLARWGILQARVVQLRHRAGTKTAWRQPSGAPRQRPPAVRLMARCLPVGAAPHRSLASPQPVQLRRQRPGAVLQILQFSAAVERPPGEAAGPAAPIAGLRGARTRVVGLRPAGTGVALAESRAGRDRDLPGPAGLPVAHQVSPPLTWLPGSDQPTTQAARPSRSRIAVLPYSHGRSGSPGTVWVRPATESRNGRRTLRRGAPIAQ
jgi:hypothetical protein